MNAYHLCFWSVQRLASDFLSNYIFLTVGRVGSSTDLIAQRVEFVQEMDKRKHLMDLLYTERVNGTNGKVPVATVPCVFVDNSSLTSSFNHLLILGFEMILLPVVAASFDSSFCGNEERCRFIGELVMHEWVLCNSYSWRQNSAGHY